VEGDDKEFGRAFAEAFRAPDKAQAAAPEAAAASVSVMETAKFIAMDALLARNKLSVKQVRDQTQADCTRHMMHKTRDRVHTQGVMLCRRFSMPC
jgi:hypothetical protein